MDFWNSNIVATITGAIIGGLIAIIASIVTYRMQQKDAERKEIRENFKHKAEFFAPDSFNVPSEKLHSAKEIDVVLCPYKVCLHNNGIKVKYPTLVNSLGSLKCSTIFLENIGESAVNSLEIAVGDPKNFALIKRDNIENAVEEGFVSYGFLSDWKVRQGDIVILTIYYFEEDQVFNPYEASLLLFYRDSLNNICEQAFFPEQEKLYPPSLITENKWRSHVSVENNLDNWKSRLSKQCK